MKFANLQAYLLCGVAAAASTSAAAAAPADPSTVMVEEIVVTAQKRSQNINDVGLTVTALSGDSLARRQVTSLEDVASVVPSLSFTNTANNNPVYTLRGVGFYETSLAAYPTTSIYLDEVALPFPALTKHSVFDLERLEVLKGPQGTLFGQNSTGGAINYIANKPSDHFEAGAHLSYGRFNAATAEGYIGGPLSEAVSARLSGRIEHADGWQESVTRPGDRLGETKNAMARLLVDFHPADGVKFTLNLNGWIDRSETQAPQLVAIRPAVPGSLSPVVAASAFGALDDRSADWTPGVPHANNRFWQAALRGDIDLAKGVTLTTITAYTNYRQRQGDEGDGIPGSTLDQIRDDGRITSFSQEARLSNGGHGPFRWVAGGNYSRDVADQLIRYQFFDSSSTVQLSAFGYPIPSSLFTSDQKMRNYAVFANGEYDLGERLTLKAGARYTNAQRTANECNQDPSGAAFGIGPFIYNVILGGAFGPYQPGDCFAVNFPLAGQAAATLGGVAPFSPGRFVDTLKEDNVSWRLGADYKPAPGALLYANISKGYKAGSYPIMAASITSQYLPVIQESVLAYEAGYKLTLADRRVQFNGAAFYYDYQDKQLRAKYVDAFFGILDTLKNVPKSTIKGFELELTARPAEGLSLNSAFTYLDAKIDRFVGTDISGNNNDFAGAEIPYTPKYQFSGNVDYETPVSDRLNAFVGASVTYRSSTVAAIGGRQTPTGIVRSAVPTVFAIDDYTLVDARLGVAAPDGGWRATLWVKNLFDEYYWNNAVAAFDTIGRYAGQPRTFGVSIDYKFK